MKNVLKSKALSKQSTREKKITNENKNKIIS